MKLCLISPPAPFATEPAMNPPLGLCYLSSYVKAHVSGIEVVGVDYALHKSYDYNKLEYLKEIPLDCDFYGITAFSAQFKWLREIIQHLNKHTKAQHIIVGGSHASACPEEVLGLGADRVVVGEGERALLDIITDKTSESILHYAGVPLSDNTLPDRELFGMKNYKRTINGEQAAHIVTLRGCPYSCRFCHKACVGREVKYQHIDNVRYEMYHLMNNYGIRSFVIYDDCFTLSHKRVYDFCDEFKKMNIQWRCWSRANHITEELLQEMKDAGLTSITFGIESGSDRILKTINKGVTAEENKRALSLCKKVGVPVRCSLMFGNPMEDVDSVEDTIQLVEECQPDEWNLAILAPVPGSEFWDHPEKYGLIFDKEWVKQQDYLVTNRFQESGVGSLWIEHVGKSKEQLQALLGYMLDGLEKVCPRKKIQDTIQIIDKDKL